MDQDQELNPSTQLPMGLEHSEGRVEIPGSLMQWQGDCILLLLDKGRTSGFEKDSIRCLDWTLMGIVSQAYQRWRGDSVFVPTMGKLKCPWVCLLDPSELGPKAIERFTKNCQGLQISRILCESESPKGEKAYRALCQDAQLRCYTFTPSPKND